MAQQRPSEHHPNSTVLLLKHIVSHGTQPFSGLVAFFSRDGSAHHLSRFQPIPQSEALAHKKAKQRIAVSRTCSMSTGLDLPLTDFEELTFNVHEQEEELVFTELTYYKIKNLKEHLAVVRYSVIDEDGTIEVTEETCEDSLEDAERLQQEIVDSIEAGIDCSIMTDQRARFSRYSPVADRRQTALIL